MGKLSEPNSFLFSAINVHCHDGHFILGRKLGEFFFHGLKNFRRFQKSACTIAAEIKDQHQREWFDDAMKYFSERYPELGDMQSTELRKLGERFAQPPKARASA